MLSPKSDGCELTFMAAKATVMEIAGAHQCISTWQRHTTPDLQNEQSQLNFMIKHCGIPGQARCSYFGGTPTSKDMDGSRCQILLQKLLEFASNKIDLNPILENSITIL